MFEAQTLRCRNKFRFGALCESLLFYGETILLVDYGSFPDLLVKCGLDNISELAQSGELKILVVEQSIGGMAMGNAKYTIGAWSGDKSKKINVIKNGVSQVTHFLSRSERMTEQLDNIIGVHSYANNYRDILGNEINNSRALNDALVIVSDGELRSSQIEIEAKQVNEFQYEISAANVSQDLINEAVNLVTLGASQIHDSSIYRASFNNTGGIANYLQGRLRSVIRRIEGDQNQIAEFHEEVLPDRIDLQSTMDQGNRQFNEFMEVWREARKFKDWIIGEPASVKLLKAYERKMAEISWLGRLATKEARFFFYTGLEVLISSIQEIPGTGTTLGVFDTFIFDKLLNKWKPDQFVLGEYSDLLNLRTL
jgi:hypothetical protein